MTDLADHDDDGPEAEFQVREVFAHFGRAVYAASCVEQGLTIALMQAELMSQVIGRARRQRMGPTRLEWEAMFDEYMARHDQLSLGTLISRFRSVVKVDPALDALLDETLQRRNHLAHAFFREEAVAFAHGVGRLAMIEDLDRDHDLFTRTDEAVQAAVAHIIPKLGIDPEKHRAQMEIITRAMVAAAKSETGEA